MILCICPTGDRNILRSLDYEISGLARVWTNHAPAHESTVPDHHEQIQPYAARDMHVI